MAVKFGELNIGDMIYDDLEDSKFVKSQKMTLISYKEKGAKLLIRSPLMKIETGGIPKEGTFYKTTKERAFIKLPFCHEREQFPDEINYEYVRQFYDKLKEIDAHFGSLEVKQKLFGKSGASKFDYSPIIREPEQDENGIYYRPPYTKIKLDLEFDTNVPKFNLYDKSSDGSKKEVELKSFDDVEQYLKFMSNVRLVIHVNKIYAMKTASLKEKKTFGVILKLHAVETTNTNRQKRSIDKDVDLFSD
jgi:hypothetical protein